MADEPISLLLSANNNKVCFIWIKFSFLDAIQNQMWLKAGEWNFLSANVTTVPYICPIVHPAELTKEIFIISL